MITIYNYIILIFSNSKIYSPLQINLYFFSFYLQLLFTTKQLMFYSFIFYCYSFEFVFLLF
ncbi:hypothetical protein H8356DRAFT_1705723 [Neocallimastix lanati (nom. inval.)]|nr:hypothetical protein H8356DRAFT_1705723 [Neocallimastix sp. JGI-2020a]